MDVSDILTRVKRSFGDESSVQVTDSDILRWINDAQRGVVLHNPEILQTTTLSNIVASQTEYAFPNDLLILNTVRIKMPQMLSYVHAKYVKMTEFDRLIDGWDGTFFGSSNLICYYTIYNRAIFLFPAPNASSTDGLKLLYTQKPTEITQALDPLSVPEQYHNAIVTYCLAQANILDEDYEASTINEAKFAGEVRSASYQEQYGARETYQTITVLEEDAW